MPYAYFDGRFVDQDKAVTSIRTHGFNYGTTVFEGLRAFYQAAENAWNLFRPYDHYQRFVDSTRVLGFEMTISEDEFVHVLSRLIQKNDFRSDVYIRPVLDADIRVGEFDNC